MTKPSSMASLPVTSTNLGGSTTNSQSNSNFDICETDDKLNDTLSPTNGVITSTNQPNPNFVCEIPECSAIFSKQHGLRVHIARKHPNLSKILLNRPTPSTSSDSSPTTSVTPSIDSQPNSVICPICNRSFSNQRGLDSHRSCHAVEANNFRTNRLLNSLIPSSESTAPPVANNAPDPTSTTSPPLSAECDIWYHKFNDQLNNITSFSATQFDHNTAQFLKFLFKANERLPGPIHPQVKMYRMRRRNNIAPAALNKGYQNSSNPQRSNARARQRRKARYDFELTQYLYYNQRRKVVQKVMHGNKNSPCPIPMKSLEKHFIEHFGSNNNRTLEHYPKQPTRQNIEVSEECVEEAIKSIKIDTSSGPDRVLMRTVKDLKIAKIIKVIVEIMLATGYTPVKLREGKTILIPKDGDTKNISNWRPITIYSVIRRIIEKILDKQLRDQLDLNSNQRGFVDNIPGCHINARLVNACLQKAKKEKTDCSAIFLDISKAFDRIGHKHIQLSLEQHGVSSNLKDLIMSLLENNSIRIHVNREASECIQIKRSVPQGGPLSPTLFNLAINYIFEELTEPNFANTYGFQLNENLDSLCLTGFADDLVVTSGQTSGAVRVAEQVTSLFETIGLRVNPKKSMAINIKKGNLKQTPISIFGETVTCINETDKIRYLGCSFNSELVFDKLIIKDLTEKINTLSTSPLLTNIQKLNLLNQYLLPMLVYPFQSAPLDKIPKEALLTLDLSIRNSVKAIVGLPTSTSTDMIYAPRKLRGLGVLCCQWEVFLQQYQINSRLLAVPDELLHSAVDCSKEKQRCKDELGVLGDTSKQLRAALRNSAYERWCSLDYQGLGARCFSSFPKSNTFMKERGNLSCSEWTAAVKLSTNYANLAGVPGVKAETVLCRRCSREKETIAHVLGNCLHNTNRRTHRHHLAKHQIAKLLTDAGFHCMDEVQCKDGSGSNRFIDILAFDSRSNKAYIIDPTIRYETNEDLDSKVQEEKSTIYSTCIPDLKVKYGHLGQREYEVIGLWIGARGTVSSGLLDFFRRFDLNQDNLLELANTVLIESLKMIHRHIYQ